MQVNLYSELLTKPDSMCRVVAFMCVCLCHALLQYCLSIPTSQLRLLQKVIFPEGNVS